MCGAVLCLGAALSQLPWSRSTCSRTSRTEEAKAAAGALARLAQEGEAGRVELLKKAEALQEECSYLWRHHQEEVGELLGQIQGCRAAEVQVQAEARNALKCEVKSLLQEICANLEGHVEQSMLQSQECFRTDCQRQPR
ncbi:hypothetical protein P7K49_008184 [Saguinus oedipus]|uniref:IF rod domain-containing protein n=1 Tax=Saguinus oedipus TaxID=9490 RepID=A0ABQ9VZC8_SAGOE|nr:hypothetical protein P7K49_008184 [Saguinus oedipus]